MNIIRPAEAINGLQSWIQQEAFWRSEACSLMETVVRLHRKGSGADLETLISKLEDCANRGLDL